MRLKSSRGEEVESEDWESDDDSFVSAIARQKS
eukprot:SAG11_NODE_39340_length_234_cov_55.659259_2_plen_32_part_01